MSSPPTGRLEPCRCPTATFNTPSLPNSKDNNPNTAYLTYSNNPQDTTGKEKGETPKVTVYDWTFSLVGNKVDEKGEPLAGAKFQLRNVHGDAIRLVKIAVLGLLSFELGSVPVTTLAFSLSLAE